MTRAGVMAFALVCAACEAGSDEPDCPGVACPTGASTADTASSGASTVGDASATAASSTTSTTSSTSTTSTSATSTSTATATGEADSGGTSAGATTESSTTAACEGPSCPVLGECFGLGVWESCAQYCNASSDSCVEGGCDGATVAYYDDVAACTGRQRSSTSDQACDAPFMMGGGVSFGRCCCQ